MARPGVHSSSGSQWSAPTATVPASPLAPRRRALWFAVWRFGVRRAPGL